MTVAGDEWQGDEPADRRQHIQHAAKNEAQYSQKSNDGTRRSCVRGLGFDAAARRNLNATLENVVALSDDVADLPGLPTFHTLIVTRRRELGVRGRLLRGYQPSIRQ